MELLIICSGHIGLLYANNFYIQWGSFGYQQNPHVVILPISSLPIQAVANDITIVNGRDSNPLCLSTTAYSQGKFEITGWRIFNKDAEDGDRTLWAHWIAICK